MKKHAQGFSLIELLIVIAIIGILVTLAIPSYKHHIERARFTEVITAAAPFKAAIAIALQEGTAIEDLNTGENGIPPAPKKTKYLEKLSVAQGIITATATKLAGGYTYILVPDAEGTQFNVGGTCVSAGLCK